MKKFIIVGLIQMEVVFCVGAKQLSENKVPALVKEAFVKRYPGAKKVSWEKEKGNFEANWGGKSGEDTSSLFTPAGVFVEVVVAIPVDQLPATVAPYIKNHYHGAGIKDAGMVTDAAGLHFFEAEIKGKGLVFDAAGKFVKED
jgi:hypothetical protein